MGYRTRATDPGQKGWNRDEPLAPNRSSKKPPVVADNKLQILDRFAFDNDLEAGVALNLCNGVYYNVSTMHAGGYRIALGTSSASAERTAPSWGIRAPCRQPGSPR